MTSTDEGHCGVGRSFGLAAAPCLSILPLGSAALSANLIETAAPGPRGRDVRLPAEDAYFLLLYLDPAEHADIQEDGAQGPARTYPAGGVCLVDLRDGAAISLRSALRAIAFVCPKPLLRRVAALSGRGSGKLRCLRGEPDPVVAHLASALWPFFGRPAASQPLLRHVAMALCAHLVHAYERPPGPLVGDPACCPGCMDPGCRCGGPRQ
ncbi:hypothetical protein [Poseidonocella sp. HB161398]|uniref:hypothetical protein n=1 Tax=Poseidonocella sp. HB161398 TaxID=2320855 RepID=UPI0014868308|nr:hypothetical protein [Poseidonocella sp. HB161398]